MQKSRMPFVLNLDERWVKEVPLTLFFKETDEVFWVSKICQMETPHFLFCRLSVSLSLKILFGLAVSPPCITSHSLSCLSASTTLSSLYACLDEAVRVTLNTKCPSVPRMWTTQCSLILKLVNIDQWHLPCIHTHTHTHTELYTIFSSKWTH